MQQLSAAKRGGVTRRAPAPHSRHPIRRTPGLEAVDQTRAQPSREASSHRVQQAIGMNPTAVTKRHNTDPEHEMVKVWAFLLPPVMNGITRAWALLADIFWMERVARAA